MMMKERRLLQIWLQFFFVTFAISQQYYPQQQYYYPQQQPQQQYYYQQQQQQPQQQTIQWPQQNIVYQQQQQTFPQVQLQQQQIPQQQQFQLQQFQQQPQSQSQSAALPQVYNEQPQQQRIQEPKISKPEEAFDLPQPPSRFLPEGSKFIVRSRNNNNNNQNSRRGGQILNNQRRPLLPRRQPPPPPPSSPQPQRRIDVAHTRAPPTVTTATPIRPAPSKPAVTRSPSLPASHLSSSRSPNKFFLDCCQKKKVAKTCESRCNFDKLSKKVLTGMFLGTDICPQAYGLDLFSCAAQDGDHRDCCRAKNVGRTGAGDKCLNFCLMTPESNFQADASYLPCWSVLNDIKSCFREAIVNGHTL